MKTVEYYEKLETKELKSILLNMEKAQYNLSSMLLNENSEDLEKKIEDYDIDISIIRMELNRRLWNSDN